MKRRVIMITLAIAVLLALILVAGCSGGAAQSGANQAAGAPAGKVITWKMATSWSKGIPLYTEMAEYFAKEVEKMSNGRLKIEVFPAGAIAPALEVSEAVRTGVAQAGHLWPGYDIGKDPTCVLFGGYAGSPNSEQMIHWIYNGGGYKLWQDWRKEKFNLVAFPLGVRPKEVFLHSRKPVRSLEDLKGLKVRTVGAWAEILPKLGASVVSLAGDEVLPALERGVIDATEWATPSEDLVMGFHEVAKYLIIPGVHQPSAPFELVINQKAWEELSADLKAIVEDAAKATTLHSWTKIGVDDLGALEKYKQAGNEIIVMDESVEREAKKYAKEWADQKASGNQWFAKVLQSQRQFEEQWKLIEKNR